MQYLTGLAIFALIVITVLYDRSRKLRPHPPGPRGFPIIGNFLDIPAKWEWQTYRKWGQDYDSKIISFKVFSKRYIVVNSWKTARDLLEKRASIYSDRPHQVMLMDLVGWDRNMGFHQYGDKWREYKRVFHQHFHQGAVPRYRATSLKHLQDLLYLLLTQPDGFLVHVRAFGAAMILDVTYGVESSWTHGTYSQVTEEAVHSLIVSANAGSYVVDYLPILRYLPSWAPGARFKRDATQWNKVVAAMFEQPFNYVKQHKADGTLNRSSITSSLLENLDPTIDNSKKEAVIRGVAGNAHIGGADTITSALLWFCFAMVMHPDIQQKAHTEIDRVVGSHRLPDHSDKDELPYITAIMMESLRWYPVVPLGMQHRLVIDDEYENYHIPAGSIVIPNAWAILHDEDTYHRPETFNPSRYILANGNLNHDVPDPMDVAFGFGRRRCPGRHFAVDQIWLIIAQVLTVFNIEKAIDASGNIIEPTEEFTSGLTSSPAPFKACFVPRSDRARALIQTPSILT